jgi:hypothetical protein
VTSLHDACGQAMLRVNHGVAVFLIRPAVVGYLLFQRITLDREGYRRLGRQAAPAYEIEGRRREILASHSRVP